MTNLTKYPLEDSFETTLAQSWDGQIGTVTLNKSPAFTFPAGITTYIIVDPGKTTMQVAEIDALNVPNKTVDVSNITLEKGAGINSTATNHTVGAKVIISDNYQFWKDILDAINSKMGVDETNVLSTGIIQFTSTTLAQLQFQNLTTVERTTLGGLLGATDNIIVKDTTDGEHYKWNGSSWDSIDTGTPASNASETVKGVIEISTVAEQGTSTDIGGSGAKLVMANANLIKTTAGAGDENKVGVLNADGLYDDLVSEASETNAGLSERATDTEATAGTDTTRYITPKQVKDNYGIRGLTTATLTFNSAGTTTAIAHGLSKPPRKLKFEQVNSNNIYGVYGVDGVSVEQKCIFTTASPGGVPAGIYDGQIAAYNQGASDYARWAVTSVNSTNINLTRTGDGSVGTTDVDYFITCEI